jgi:hypothetical protein
MIGSFLAIAPTYFVIFGASLLVSAGFGCVLLIGLRTGRFGPWSFILRDRYPTLFRLDVMKLVLIIIVLLAAPFYIVWKLGSGN